MHFVKSTWLHLAKIRSFSRLQEHAKWRIQSCGCVWAFWLENDRNCMESALRASPGRPHFVGPMKLQEPQAILAPSQWNSAKPGFSTRQNLNCFSQAGVWLGEQFKTLAMTSWTDSTNMQTSFFQKCRSVTLLDCHSMITVWFQTQLGRPYPQCLPLGRPSSVICGIRKNCSMGRSPKDSSDLPNHHEITRLCLTMDVPKLPC